MKRILPETTFAGGLKSPDIARARVDLPEPLSPAIPKISPLYISKLTPSTAFMMPWGR